MATIKLKPPPPFRGTVMAWYLANVLCVAVLIMAAIKDDPLMCALVMAVSLLLMRLR